LGVLIKSTYQVEGGAQNIKISVEQPKEWTEKGPELGDDVELWFGRGGGRMRKKGRRGGE